MKEWVMMPPYMHESEGEINHYTGHYVPYSLRRVCGFFNVPQIYYMCKGLWDGAYDLSSLSETTLGGPPKDCHPEASLVQDCRL